MGATKRERTIISRYFWKHGTGSKKRLAEQLGLEPSEITRMLTSGTISDEKLKSILEVVNQNGGTQ